MGVYFRTGENTAAGVSWPTYFLLVLPVQLLIVWPLKAVYWFFRGTVWACVLLFTLTVAAAHTMQDRRHEDRPPAA